MYSSLLVRVSSTVYHSEVQTRAVFSEVIKAAKVEDGEWVRYNASSFRRRHADIRNARNIS